MYFFRQITTIIKVRVSFVFGLHTIKLIDFTKAIQLKGLKPKNKGHMNFYECCDLTKKVYLEKVPIYKFRRCLERCIHSFRYFHSVNCF